MGILTGPTALRGIVFLFGLAATVFGAGRILRWVLQDLSVPDDHAEIRKTSQRTGYFERFLIFVLVVTNNVQAVGFLITAKSILRFSEIKEPKDRQLAEYVLLGTLASFSYGLALSFLTRQVLDWLASQP